MASKAPVYQMDAQDVDRDSLAEFLNGVTVTDGKLDWVAQFQEKQTGILKNLVRTVYKLLEQHSKAVEGKIARVELKMDEKMKAEFSRFQRMRDETIWNENTEKADLNLQEIEKSIEMLKSMDLSSSRTGSAQPGSGASSAGSSQPGSGASSAIGPRGARGPQQQQRPHEWFLKGFNGDVASSDPQPKGNLFKESLLETVQWSDRQESHELSFGGKTTEEASNSFSVSAGVNGGFGGLFSASVKSEFSQRGVTSHSTCFKQIRELWILEKFEQSDVAATALRPHLDETAQKLLDHGDPEKLFSQYGYFFLTSIERGGKFYSTYSSMSDKMESEQDFGLAVSAEGGLGPVKLGAEVGMKFGESTKLANETYDKSTDAFGGEVQVLKNGGTKEEWQETVTRNPTIAKLKFQGIWTLCEDQDRAELLESVAKRKSQEMMEENKNW